MFRVEASSGSGRLPAICSRFPTTTEASQLLPGMCGGVARGSVFLKLYFGLIKPFRAKREKFVSFFLCHFAAKRRNFFKRFFICFFGAKRRKFVLKLFFLHFRAKRAIFLCIFRREAPKICKFFKNNRKIHQKYVVFSNFI